MRIPTANLLATIALALCAPGAMAQGMTGAGGSGGAGGGADPRGLVVVREVVPASRCATREPAADRISVKSESMMRYGLAQVPPLDPARKVNEVSCTQPFDFLGKGNLCCI